MCCVHECLCSCMSTGTFLSQCTCGVQRTMRHHSSPHTLFEASLHYALHLPYWLACVLSLPPILQSHRHTGITHATTTASSSFFKVGSGIQTHILMFVVQKFYPLSHLLSFGLNISVKTIALQLYCRYSNINKIHEKKKGSDTKLRPELLYSMYRQHIVYLGSAQMLTSHRSGEELRDEIPLNGSRICYVSMFQVKVLSYIPSQF